MSDRVSKQHGPIKEMQAHLKISLMAFLVHNKNWWAIKFLQIPQEFWCELNLTLCLNQDLLLWMNCTLKGALLAGGDTILPRAAVTKYRRVPEEIRNIQHICYRHYQKMPNVDDWWLAASKVITIIAETSIKIPCCCRHYAAALGWTVLEGY